MAVKIRLKRIGAKKNPFYRIVVSDSRSSRDGRLIDELGYYNPLTEPQTIKIDNEKVEKWLSNGATPTATVERLFKNSGLYEEKEVEKTVE